MYTVTIGDALMRGIEACFLRDDSPSAQAGYVKAINGWLVDPATTPAEKEQLRKLVTDFEKRTSERWRSHPPELGFVGL